MSTKEDAVVQERLLVTLEHMDAELKNIKLQLEKNFVTQDQFWPIKTIVYSGAGITLVSVLGAVIALAVHK